MAKELPAPAPSPKNITEQDEARDSVTPRSPYTHFSSEYAALTPLFKPKEENGTRFQARALILIENQLTKLTGSRSKGLFVGKAQ